ncbi:uncharacterized protein LOC116199111 [Punica granatum]|uniref:Uncharacterized protein LOC116199111 n=1 Tax=Punica granatum TaxID=22663 RepID=A0A6P8D130_PUNGR|nr:uncharacterized protein LOC116199111 [Punica granatum]XP_031385264.1 uncharacterized protein LOC116199111 [Punica granatum]
MKAVNKKFNRFLEHALDEHERGRGGEGYGDKDMVDVLLWLADDPNLVVKLERHGVKLFTLLLRGHEFPQRGGKPEWIAPPNPGRRPWLRLLKKIAASDHLVLQFETLFIESSKRGSRCVVCARSLVSTGLWPKENISGEGHAYCVHHLRESPFSVCKNTERLRHDSVVSPSNPL